MEFHQIADRSHGVEFHILFEFTESGKELLLLPGSATGTHQQQRQQQELRKSLEGMLSVFQGLCNLKQVRKLSDFSPACHLQQILACILVFKFLLHRHLQILDCLLSFRRLLQTSSSVCHLQILPCILPSDFFPSWPPADSRLYVAFSDMQV